jgi:hypothetical protein
MSAASTSAAHASAQTRRHRTRARRRRCAYLALTRVAHLQPAETVLVHGALGGLASTFPGVARSLGASTVIGTVHTTSLPTAMASGLLFLGLHVRR